jgi:hypothetical protein
MCFLKQNRITKIIHMHSNKFRSAISWLSKKIEALDWLLPMILHVSKNIMAEPIFFKTDQHLKKKIVYIWYKIFIII